MPENESHGRFGILLATIIAVMGITSWAYETGHTGPLFSAVNSALLVVGVYVVGRERRFLWIGIAMVGPAVVTRWAWEITGTPPLLEITLALTLAFLFLMSALILNEMRKKDHVDGDTVLGGVCVYLLLVLGFMYTHGLIEVLLPGSYAVAGNGVLGSEAGLDDHAFVELLYFSLVTITTLGYGDILPIGATSRLAAGAEAMFGQLFLAIFIARLVGLYTAHEHARRREAAGAPSSG